ncbi:MAG: hypothetical protein HYY68_03025 [Thaumarchaeota archaeon]|nr:hypothetical protein [Nitrososphaerota archaeon]
MTLQILLAFRQPTLVLLAILIASGLAVVLLYFDQFLFVAPYFTFYLPPDRVATFLLDAAVSVLSGVVLALSVYQVKAVRNDAKRQGKIGIAGIVAAFLAGACPCYYLVPLLAVAGGVGGALGTVGILFYAYQLPVKLASVVLLIFVSFSLERSIRASCAAADELP